MFENRRHASPKEQIQRLIDVELDAVPRERMREAAAAQHFTIDQHSVAIEDD
jgi:hypothetical protein